MNQSLVFVGVLFVVWLGYFRYLVYKMEKDLLTTMKFTINLCVLIQNISKELGLDDPLTYSQDNQNLNETKELEYSPDSVYITNVTKKLQ